ncbi:multidrug resistance-associated protein 1-like isoform X2 [Gigantopelta aegis]|uniref:multidrug resistance-associated protein 1-like isoform X2 n=1 Tax=Gigantopelta aegis TaxID=1735272 RepID=UPI001B889EF6|nr:multidrug resistance-associated protein 1-like isoform X2 [Gigantopelta aegis]
MDNFCNGTLVWNEDTTWNHDWPEFTACFQDSVLVWVPCAWLWITAPLYIYYLSTVLPGRVVSHCPYIGKLFVVVVLLLLSVLELLLVISHEQSGGFSIQLKSFLLAPVVKALTFILCFVLLVVERKKGLISSGVLFIFWLLLSISGIIPFYTKIIQQVYTEDLLGFSLFYIYYMLVLLELLLHCFAEKPYSTQSVCPETIASFLSRLSFWWANRVLYLGYKKPLTVSDVPSLNPRELSSTVVPRFTANWRQQVDKARRRLQHQQSLVCNHVEESGTSESTPLLAEVKTGKKKSGKAPKPSLERTLMKTFGLELLQAQFWKLCNDGLLLLNPLILGLLIDFTEDKSVQEWKGYLYAAILFCSIFLQSVFFHQTWHQSTSLGLRIRASIISAVFKKALTMDNKSRKKSTMGEIVNLMSVDTEHVQNMMGWMWTMWSSPLQVCLCLYLLYTTLGPAMFAGLALLLILFPINGVTMAFLGKYQEQLMAVKDTRIKLVNEVLSGIKILKLYAWEPSFEQKILDVRNKELKIILKMSLLDSFMTFSWTVAPYAAVISLRRIGRFLSRGDLETNNVIHDPHQRDAIVIDDANFSWSEEAGLTLHNISLKVAEGELIAVVGQVGSGKSSLISAILGDIKKLSGYISTRGRLAYVPQQAWIQNDTIQNNILFGQPIRREEYENVLDICALKPDLEILQAGDLTEIGERGINLSGGQKQRVSLARAVYSDADIFLLDDPLSAVDSHVGKQIFEQVIGDTGVLRGKTRVFVTHGLQWLPKVDTIVVLIDGRVSEIGSYDDLLDHNGPFAQFLRMYLLQSEDEGEDDPEVFEMRHTVLERLSSIRSEEDETDVELREKIRKQSESKALDDDVKDKEKASELKAAAPDKLIEEETVESGRVKFAVFIKLARAIGIPFVFLIIGLYILFETAAVMANVWLSEWTDDASLANFTALPVNSSERTDKNDFYVGIYGAFGVAQSIFVIGFSITVSLRSVHSSRHLHRLMLSNVLKAPQSFFDTTPTGRIVNRFSQDLDTIDNELPLTFEMFIDCAVLVLGTLIVISYSTPIFLVAVIPTGILYTLIQRFYIPTSRQLKRLESKYRSPIYSHFSETISGSSVIRAYGVEEDFIRMSEKKVDINQKFDFYSFTCNRWLGFRLELLGNFVILAATMFAVSSRDVISGGLVGLSISYALEMTGNLNWLVRMTSDLETQVVSVERVKEYTEIETEADWHQENCHLDPSWPQFGLIQFKNYCTRYRPGLDLVLQDVSCVINPGERVGIVGRTGAGKSSLMFSLFRLVEPATGEITIDGVDISTIGLHDLRSRLTILPQDPVMFVGSLRLNVDPLDIYSDEEIWTALEHAHLKTFVESLPDKLLHESGEGGENLSVGQKQLLCLARALLKKTKILILDEATAAVDMATDVLIQETIRSEFKGCTVLTIAHRLNTVMDYDRILVLDQGRVDSFDSPSTLLQQKSGIFYQMAVDADIVS